jgi:hypothetical protein
LDTSGIDFSRQLAYVNSTPTRDLALEISSNIPQELESAGRLSNHVLKRSASSSASKCTSSSSSKQHAPLSVGKDYRAWQYSIVICGHSFGSLSGQSLLPVQKVLNQFSCPAAGEHGTAVGCPACLPPCAVTE